MDNGGVRRMVSWWLVLVVGIPVCILGALFFYALGLSDEVAKELTLRKIAKIRGEK